MAKRGVEGLTVIATVGGEGTRLYPLTLTQPKPLIPICNTAILHMMFEHLIGQGCRDIILAQKGFENSVRLKDYFINSAGLFGGRRRPVSFRMQPKYDDMGSGDAVRYCMEYYDLRGPVLVVSGDNILNIDAAALLSAHRRRRADMTVLVTRVPDPSGYGIAETAPDGRVTGFVEKPPPGQARSNMANAAVYLISPSARDIFRRSLEKMVGMKGDGRPELDFGKNVIPYMVRNQRVYAVENSGYWNDIGSPANYLDATVELLSRRPDHLTLPDYAPLKGRPSVLVHRSVREQVNELVDGGRITVGSRVIIGRDAQIGDNCRIESCSIGDYCQTGAGARLTRSVLMDFSLVGERARLDDAIVGRHSAVESGRRKPSVLHPGSVAGENINLPPGTHLKEGERAAPVEYAARILSTNRYSQVRVSNGIFFFRAVSRA